MSNQLKLQLSNKGKNQAMLQPGTMDAVRNGESTFLT